MKLYTAILAASLFMLSCATAKPTNKFRVQCLDKYVWHTGDTICVTQQVDYVIQKGTGDTVLRVIKGNGIGGILPAPSPIPDSIPVIKVKQYQLFRDWCSSVEYRDDAGNSYIVHCLTRIVYNKHPASSGKKASELKVRLDTGGVVMTVNEPNYPRFPSPSPLPDTTVKPKYEYFYSVRIPIPVLNPSLDTLNRVIRVIGKSLSVDEADYYQSIMGIQIDKLLRSLRLDSVKIENKKP